MGVADWTSEKSSSSGLAAFTIESNITIASPIARHEHEHVWRKAKGKGGKGRPSACSKAMGREVVSSGRPTTSSGCAQSLTSHTLSASRPKSIDEVAAQEHTVNVLRKTLLSSNLPHMLFYGPPGDRKSTRLNSSHSGESRMPSSA